MRRLALPLALLGVLVLIGVLVGFLAVQRDLENSAEELAERYETMDEEARYRDAVDRTRRLSEAVGQDLTEEQAARLLDGAKANEDLLTEAAGARSDPEPPPPPPSTSSAELALWGGALVGMVVFIVLGLVAAAWVLVVRREG